MNLSDELDSRRPRPRPRARRRGGSVERVDDRRLVKALSHPLRVRILATLAERVASPSALAGWLRTSLGTVAYHVRTLEELGMIELVDETPVRGAVEHHYRALPMPTVTPDEWRDAPVVAKQAVIGAQLQIISAYARAAAAAGGFDPPEARLRRCVLRLDGRGFAQLSKAVDKLLEQAEKIETAVAERTGDGGTEGIAVGLGTLLFETRRVAGTDERARGA